MWAFDCKYNETQRLFNQTVYSRGDASIVMLRVQTPHQTFIIIINGKIAKSLWFMSNEE